MMLQIAAEAYLLKAPRIYSRSFLYLEAADGISSPSRNASV